MKIRLSFLFSGLFLLTCYVARDRSRAKWFVIIFLLAIPQVVSGQTDHIDSLNMRSFELRSKSKDSSYMLATQALGRSEEINYEKGKFRARLNLGMYYLNTDSLEIASGYLLECNDFFEESKDGFFQAATSWYLAKLYLRLGENVKSEKFYRQASAQFEALGERKMQFFVMNGLGVLHERQGHLAEALEIYQDLLITQQDLDLPQGGRHHIYNNIASILKKLGQHEEALKYVLIAIREADALKTPHSESHRKASEIYHLLGNEDSSRFHLNRSLQIAIDHKRTDMIALAYFKMADYLELEGDVSGATNFVRKGVRLLKGSKSVARIFEAEYRLADLYMTLNDQDSAVFYLNKSFRTAENGGLITLKKSSASKLSSYYESIGALDSAYKYLQKVEVLQRQLFDQQMAEQFSKLNIAIATLEKEKELQTEKTQKIRAENQRTQIMALSGIAFLIAGLFFISYRQRTIKRQLKLEKEKQSLSSELEHNKQLLSTQTLSMIHKNNGFTEIAENLKEGNGQSSTKIKKIIDINMALEKDWENFNKYFSFVHGDFYSNLEERHPALSITETRLCSMVKMGLKNKEMATILNIEYSSITMAKYRLKKKLQLAEDEDVNNYLRSI